MAKIMLVEDDNNLREIYEARLLAEGYEVISTKDGEEALALATKEKPDLIISDVMMPKISGFDMLDILRTTPGVENTKVVMMTALSQAEDKERADKLGADKYLVKSQVTLEDVAQVADELLNGSGDETAKAAPTGADSEPQTEVADATQAPEPDSEGTQQPAPTPQPAPAPAPEPQPAPAPAQDAQNNTAEQPAAPAQPTPPPTPAPTMPEVSTEQPQTDATDNTSTQPNQEQAPTPQPNQEQAPTPQPEPTQEPAQAEPAPAPAPEPQPAPAPAQDAQNNTAEQPAAPAQPTPPPTPAPTMPEVSTEQPQTDATDNPTTAPDTSSDTTQNPNGSNPTGTTDQANTAQPQQPVDSAPTTAEEEAAIDKEIDDFVKNQLQSNEPPQPETPTQNEQTDQAQSADPNDQLNQGNGFTLPSAEPTQTIEVKAPPQSQGGDQQAKTPTPPAEQQPATPPTGNTETSADTAPQPTPNETPQPTTAPQEPQLAEPQANKPDDASTTPSAATGGQRVIQPINNMDQSKPDLTQLASEEEENNQTQSNLPASSVVSPNGQTVTPPNPQAKPESGSPGNVIQPGGSQNQTPQKDDPSNIAL